MYDSLQLVIAGFDESISIDFFTGIPIELVKGATYVAANA